MRQKSSVQLKIHWDDFIACLLVAYALSLPALAFGQDGAEKLYTLDSKNWQRNKTPAGEVFTCSVCEAQIQVQIDAGPPLGPDAKYKSNEQFLATLRTPEQQKQFADGMLRAQIPLQSGFNIRIERTGLTKIGGQEAFQYMAIVELKPTATRDTTMLLIYKNRLVKISVNYYEGSFSPKARDAIGALFASIKFI
jgi:hypothetical protein